MEETAPTDLDSIYRARFGERESPQKDAVWREICRYLQRFVVPGAPVLDVACDRGEFIRHVEAPEKWAVDLRDVGRWLGDGVRFVQCDAPNMDSVLPAGYFGTVFMSNYLEHLHTGQEILRQLSAVHAVLRQGGRLLILHPNIRLTGAAYWDFLDHHKAMTERTLREAGEACGLTTWKVITRFLPYTTKSRIPQHPWLVRAYLALPPAWWLMGKQTLYIGVKAG